jgi:hypothetical protein
VKITRMRTLYKKLRDGVEKLKADNAKELGYASGMMGPGGGEGQHGRRTNKSQCAITAEARHIRGGQVEWVPPTSKMCKNKLL